MYTVVNWSEELDLGEFYKEAGTRGFANNASQKAMIDCFRNEPEWAAWILYQDDKAVGSVVAHSFTPMGPNAYRVLARTCTFGTARQNGGLITSRKLIAEHQNLTDQFLLPACINWAKWAQDSNLLMIKAEKLNSNSIIKYIKKLKSSCFCVSSSRKVAALVCIYLRKCYL